MNRSTFAIFSAFMFFAITAASFAAETPQVIKWDNLLPTAPPLEDPFKALTTDQLYDLETLVYIRKEQDASQGPKDPADEAQIAELTNTLEAAKFDVKSLLAQYTGYLEEIEHRNKTVVADMEGRLVRLAGYVLPLEFNESGVNEFLLVPYVGACIHVPPPPPNQIVYVRLNQKTFKADDMYMPVWVTGRMTVKPTSKDLSMGDGQASVPIGYTLDSIKIEPYKN